MNVKTKVGLVFAAGILLTFGGMIAALSYANKLLGDKPSSDKAPDANNGTVNAEEPENFKDETLNK